LRLIQKAPEIADDGGRQHHRQQDQRRPEGVAAKLSVDQISQREADQRLQTMVQNTKCAVVCIVIQMSWSSECADSCRSRCSSTGLLGRFAR
jgi:hypothetical protein